MAALFRPSRQLAARLCGAPRSFNQARRCFAITPNRNPRVVCLTETEKDDVIPSYRAVLEPYQVPDTEYEVEPREVRESIPTFELSEKAMEDPLFKNDFLSLLTPHGFSTSFSALVKYGLDDPQNFDLLPDSDLDESILAEAIISYAQAHEWDLEQLCLDMYRLSEFLELNEEIFCHLTGKVSEEEREDLIDRISEFLALGEDTADILRYMSARKSQIRFSSVFPVLQRHLRPLTRLDVVQVLSAEPLLPDQRVRLENNLLQVLSFGTPGNTLAVDYRVLNDIKTGFQLVINMDSGMNFRPDEHMDAFRMRCVEDRRQLFRDELDLGPLSVTSTMYDIPKTKEEWLQNKRGLPGYPMVYKIEEKWFNPKIGPQ